jgi:serine/threonine-protein kinase RsbW
LAEQVRLRIPATTGHIGLARATATSLAARLDFTYDRLMDLHIAIDETGGRVLAACDPPARHLDVTFEIRPDALAITVRGDSRLKPGAEFLNSWSRLILESVAGDISVSDDETSAGVSFVVKRGELA